MVLGLLRWSSATLEDCIKRSEAAKEGKRPFLAVLVSYTPLAHLELRAKELQPLAPAARKCLEERHSSSEQALTVDCSKNGLHAAQPGSSSSAKPGQQLDATDAQKTSPRAAACLESRTRRPLARLARERGPGREIVIHAVPRNATTNPREARRG